MKSVLLFSLLFSFPLFASENKKITNVFTKEGTIYYQGDLSEEANKRVKLLITPMVKTLEITSVGGEINAGMDLGELVRDNQLNVSITQYCFSSCANYVFPAGRKKYLSRNSLLGWHGGAKQKYNLADFPEKERANFLSYIKKAIVRETNFFQSIGVKQISTTYGQSTAFEKEKINGYEGWYYSIAAMKQLGINHIVLKESNWEPAGSFNGKKIYRIDKIQY